MTALDLSTECSTRKLLHVLLAIALGDNHLVWIDGQSDVNEINLNRIFPRAAKGPGRPLKKPEPREQKPPIAQLAFWHDGQRLDLDEEQAELVRRALAERIALLLSSQETALALLKLCDYDIDWEQVLREGVEVIGVGATQGNRIRLVEDPSHLVGK